MEDATATKVCSTCKAPKPLDEFHRKRASRDGLNSRCKPCAKAASTAWAKANAERKRARDRAYREASRERIATAREAYMAANRERDNARRRQRRREDPEWRAKQNAMVAAWISVHPERMTDHYHQKRARRSSAIVGSNVDLAALWTGACGICGRLLDAALAHPDPMSKSVDHIVPLARGGTHTQDNLQWAHLRCNITKGARVD